MNNPITTTGLSGGAINSTKQSGESTAAWVKRHDDQVSDDSPGGNTLTTTWTSAGGPESVVTNRNAGESPKEFRLRHQNEYLVCMFEAPPVP